MSDLIARVTHMEACMERVEEALKRGELESVHGQIKALQTYMESGQWLQDYQADERGELPKDMKRGVLSEDGLYNLLCEIDEK